MKQGALRILYSLLIVCAIAHLHATETAALNAARAAGAKPSVADNIPRPFVLCNDAKVSWTREQIASNPGTRKLYESLKVEAEQSLLRDVTIPIRSGHYHDYTCTDGTRLKLPPNLYDIKSATTGNYECPQCGSKYSGPKFDGAVRHAQHVAIIGDCLNLALVGAIDRRLDCTKKAAEILIAYADAYPGRHISSTKGGIFYQSLDESVHMISLAQAYDFVRAANALTPAQIDHIEQNLFWEVAEGLMRTSAGGNWHSWHLSAVGVIGFATGHQRFIDYGIAQFKRQIEHELGHDGLWPESVHTYHFYPMRGYLQLAEAAGNAGIDLYDYEPRKGQSLRAMFLQPLQYMYPDFQLPAINDGWFGVSLPRDLYQLGYARLKIPELGWVVEQMRELPTYTTNSPDEIATWDLLHSGPVTESKTPDFQSTNFSNIGIATLRMGTGKNEKMITFDYGRHLGHGQSDKMGITFFGDGQLLAADYGTPSYGSAILPYYKGSMSHNTIHSSGRNQPYTTDSVALLHGGNSANQIAIAQTTQALPGARWRRAVIMNPDYVLLWDETSSTQPLASTWTFHGPTSETRCNAREVYEEVKYALPHLTNIRALSTDSPDLKVEWINNSSEALLAAITPAQPCQKHLMTDAPAATAGTKTAKWVIETNATNTSIPLLLQTGSEYVRLPATLQLHGNSIKVSTANFTDTWTLTSSEISCQRTTPGKARSVYTYTFTTRPE